MDQAHVSEMSNQTRSSVCNDRKHAVDIQHRSVTPNVEIEKRALKKENRHFKQRVMLLELLIMSETIMQKALKLENDSRILLASISNDSSADAF